MIRGGTLDAELAALVWVLVEAGIPLVVAAPDERQGAADSLLEGVLASVAATSPVGALDAAAARDLVRGGRPGIVVPGSSLEDVRRLLAGPGFDLSDDELTFLGCVLILGPKDDGSPAGALRVTAAHYVRPLARDAHGHAQRLGPAVVMTWDERDGRWEHFEWGVLPEIAARIGRRAGDLDADLHHRRDDLAGLAAAGVTGLDEVRRLIAGYRVGYGEGHVSGGPATHAH